MLESNLSNVIYNLKGRKLACEYVCPLNVCTRVSDCALVLFFIQLSVSLDIKLQLYFGSINQKIHWHFCVIPYHYQWQFFSQRVPLGIFTNYSLSNRGNFKITRTFKVKQLAVSGSSTFEGGCGEVFQKCNKCLGPGSQRLTRSQLGFWTAQVNNNGLLGPVMSVTISSSLKS